jgi:hypothetical protein
MRTAQIWRRQKEKRKVIVPVAVDAGFYVDIFMVSLMA